MSWTLILRNNTSELKRDIIQMCCENVRKKSISCSTQAERPILRDTFKSLFSHTKPSQQKCYFCLIFHKYTWWYLLQCYILYKQICLSFIFSDNPMNFVYASQKSICQSVSLLGTSLILGDKSLFALSEATNEVNSCQKSRTFSSLMLQLLCRLLHKETLACHVSLCKSVHVYTVCIHVCMRLNVCVVLEPIDVCLQSPLPSHSYFRWLCGGGLTGLPPNGGTPHSLTWCWLLAHTPGIPPDHKIGWEQCCGLLTEFPLHLKTCLFSGNFLLNGQVHFLWLWPFTYLLQVHLMLEM